MRYTYKVISSKTQSTKSNTLFSGKSFLITGGTGSFGQAFTERILRDFPDIGRLVIYSRDEFKQFTMQSQPLFQNPKMRFFIGDVRDKDRLQRALKGIDIVIHAAALKQITTCEYNPFEAIKTNVLGAQNLIEAAIDANVEKVIALSTDKACSPINLYGATKLCSDKLFIAGNAYVGQARTQFSVVRYGNVAASRGSVIPFFQDLLDKGANFLPITDERMTRFWLNIDEAVDLVLIALETMIGGELFVKKIPSIKITDLAEAMAPDLPTKIVGIRPGEKIHEVMISSDDAHATEEYPSYFVIKPEYLWTLWGRRPAKKGIPVATDFVYHSGNNTEWLDRKEIRRRINQIQSRVLATK